MRIFIDVTTGTWGHADDLRIVDVDDTDIFDQMADSSICAFGHENGERV